jgi:hypothetical protein
MGALVKLEEEAATAARATGAANERVAGPVRETGTSLSSGGNGRRAPDASTNGSELEAASVANSTTRGPSSCSDTPI